MLITLSTAWSKTSVINGIGHNLGTSHHHQAFRKITDDPWHDPPGMKRDDQASNWSCLPWFFISQPSFINKKKHFYPILLVKNPREVSVFILLYPSGHQGHLESGEQLRKLSNAWARRSTFSSDPFPMEARDVGPTTGRSATNLASIKRKMSRNAEKWELQTCFDLFISLASWDRLWYNDILHWILGLSCEQPPQGNPSHMWIVIALVLGNYCPSHAIWVVV